MATVVDKIQELEYNELVTLGVIEQNEDLFEIFKSEVKMPINLLYNLQKNGSLNDETKTVLRDFFDKLILTKQAFINQYLKLAGLEPTDVKPVVEKELKLRPDVLPVAEPEPIGLDPIMSAKGVPTKIVEKTIAKAKEQGYEVKEVKEKEIPRRYGKEKIDADIKAQGHNATQIQRAGLKLNKLKNLNQVIVNKFIKDYHSETRVLTDDDYAKIEASVTMFERSLDAILKKK